MPVHWLEHTIYDFHQQFIAAKKLTYEKQVLVKGLTNKVLEVTKLTHTHIK
jgi:hypothetical protein